MTDRHTSTRDALAALVTVDPEISAAEAARQLGVSRERVRQLSDALGITLKKYRRPLSAGRRAPEPVVLTGGVPAKISCTAAGAIGELLAAADLTARGWTVFYPLTRIATCDLVAVDVEGRVERVEVRCGKRTASGHLQWSRPDRSRSDRVALVITGEPVQYEPPYPGDATLSTRKRLRPQRTRGTP